jgi:hypothetical protein
MVHYLAQLSYLCRRFTFDMAADDYNIIRCTSQIIGGMEYDRFQLCAGGGDE